MSDILDHAGSEVRARLARAKAEYQVLVDQTDRVWTADRRSGTEREKGGRPSRPLTPSPPARTRAAACEEIVQAMGDWWKGDDPPVNLSPGAKIGDRQLVDCVRAALRLER